MENTKEGDPDPMGLSDEQSDTERLLRQLLGTAVADRYADFCRLSSGRLPLLVSRPLAGHALRELDSWIRGVLATPLDARAADNPQEQKLRAEAQRQLRKMGFGDRAVQKAEKALRPEFSHKGTIERIVRRLGLDPAGDVAKLWIELNNTYGRVHERSFHEALVVDDDFRREYAQRFDTVIRVLAIQLQTRYGALMRRAKQIAAMRAEDGIDLFMDEIPGALQVQQYFYDHLQSEEWLPLLEKNELLGEPLPDAQIGKVVRLWEWPVGRYLTRMASSANVGTRTIVARALRNLKTSTHPDVQRFALDAMAALPPAEAAALVDLVEAWVTPETAPFLMLPHKILPILARSGEVEAALRVALAVFQVFQRDGRAGGFFEPTMYEHYIKGAVEDLAKAGPLQAVVPFCDLLMRASRLEQRWERTKEEDYSYYMVGSLVPNQHDGGGILASIVWAIVRFAEAAVETNAAVVRQVLDALARYRPKIFRRIGLHIAARAADEVPELVTDWLTDTTTIATDWCRDEYAELARAWFPKLPEEQQASILSSIDSLAEEFLERWRAGFENYEKRKPGPEDERKFRETSFRDVVWLWRDVLPAARRATLERTVAEFGDPDSERRWRWAHDEALLTRATMQTQPIEDTIAFLAAWRPDPEARSRTAQGLANELREAAAHVELFSAEAVKFAGLRPIFVRHLFEGLRLPTANQAKIAWEPCLELLEAIVRRSQKPADSLATMVGDDPDWSWTLRSGMGWLAGALGRGADGPSFVHGARIEALVLALYHRLPQGPAVEALRGEDRKHPSIVAGQTSVGAALELCILLIFWLSKDPESSVGRAPREALAQLPEVRAILDAALEDQTASGWVARAMIGRRLSWMTYFAEGWLRDKFALLFPAANDDLRTAAWVSYLQHHGQPVDGLTDILHPLYVAHIDYLGVENAPPAYAETANHFVDFLIILYLWEALPDDLLQRFWNRAPPPIHRHAMWFVGRHMLQTNMFRGRAMGYWEARLQAALRARDPEPFRSELGAIGAFFLWDVDTTWLLDQLLIMLNGGFGPNDAFGVVDALAKLLPDRTDRVVEVTNLLVRQPQVHGWVFAAQDQSLRSILEAGKKSAAPRTAATVREIVNFLASRGNPSFLDLDDEKPSV